MWFGNFDMFGMFGMNVFYWCCEMFVCLINCCLCIDRLFCVLGVGSLLVVDGGGVVFGMWIVVVFGCVLVM